MTIATPSPAIVRSGALSALDPGRAAHLRHRRRAVERQPRGRLARSRTSWPRSAPCCCSHKVLFFRDQDITRAEHVAFARHFGELEDHPVAGSDPENPGLVRIYKSPRAAQRPLRERLAHRRHLAREAAVRLRAALRRVPAGRRRHDVGQHGAGLRAACPSRSRPRSPACAPATASRPASAPRCRSKSASRCTRSSRMPSIRWCARIPRPARRSCSSTPSRRTSPISTRPTTCATARTTRRGASQLLQYLISQAHHPRVPGALALAAEQRGHVGQPLDPALRGHGLPALPPKDGTRRNRRRHALLNTHDTSDPHPGQDMNFLDGSLFPENQDKLVITAAPYGPEWIPSDFPEDIPVTMQAQVQKAVDCYNAGATVLHLHVRELDGKGSQEAVQVQRADRRRAQGRARHGDPGRRLDLLRARRPTAPRPSGCRTTPATCWPSSIPSRTRSRSPSTPRR